ncbi:hypothetical protein ASG94_17450 [Nocardioides sp. Soil805]|nr:hypothetical protein ASG94_17450 [Nocardioides sp. Soil805]
MAGGGVAGAMAATNDGPHQVDRPKAVEKRYLYSATFTASVTQDLKIVYPGFNNEEEWHLSASIAGVHPALEVSTENSELVPRSTRSRVTVQSARATTSLRTDDGRVTSNCEGSTVEIGGRPTPVPGLLFGSNEFLAYGALAFPTTCTDNQGGPPGTGTYFLPKLDAELTPTSGEPGDALLTYAIDGAVGTAPLQYELLCPGYEEGPSNTCAYQIRGTLKLKLIKEIVAPTGASKGASVTPGATKAAVLVQCPAACRAEIEVMPLRGSPRVLARDTVSLVPGKRSSVQVPIPKKNRRPAVRSGGVRIRITYRIPLAGAFSEERRALL